MKRSNNKYSILPIIVLLSLASFQCKKNATRFFPDEEAKGLSIFSNKSNNVMSCYIDETPWRTRDRVYTFFMWGGIREEISIGLLQGTTLNDTLVVNWYGEGDERNTVSSMISLYLLVKKGFKREDFISLQGERVMLDGANGFIKYSNLISPVETFEGAGTIYFHAANLEEIEPASNTHFRGILSGIFAADLGSKKITKGRFDHSLNEKNTYISP